MMAQMATRGIGDQPRLLAGSGRVALLVIACLTAASGMRTHVLPARPHHGLRRACRSRPPCFLAQRAALLDARAAVALSGAGALAGDEPIEPRSLPLAAGSAAAVQPVAMRSRPRRFVSWVNRVLTGLLPVWILCAALLAVRWPSLFTWFSGQYYTAGLGVMMLSTALTLRVDDFTAVVQTGKSAVLAGVAVHLLIKPPLALGLAKALGLAPSALAGLVLLAAAPAAQATSVAVLLARGNVALSVCVVTILNLIAFLATPLITKTLGGGAAVAVSAAAMSRTTIQVVLAPIILGLLVNSRYPAVRNRAARVGPLIGSVIATLFAGSGTAMIAPALTAVTRALYAAVGLFHVAGSLLCFLSGRLLGLSRADSRVLALIGAMQSSSLAFLLATRHLPDSMSAVPSALSVSTMLLWGMTLAVAMSRLDTREEAAAVAAAAAAAAAEG